MCVLEAVTERNLTTTLKIQLLTLRKRPFGTLNKSFHRSYFQGELRSDILPSNIAQSCLQSL